MLFETNKGGVNVPPVNKTFRAIAQSQRMTQVIISVICMTIFNIAHMNKDTGANKLDNKNRIAHG